MKTITSKRPLYAIPFSNRFAAGLKLLGLSALSLAAIGCTGGIELQAKRPTFEAQAEFGGAASAQAAAAPAPASPAPASYESAQVQSSPTGFPTSGGTTPATAEFIELGGTIEGTVGAGERRYYRFDVAAGQEEKFSFYSELTEPSSAGTNVVVRVLAADGEKLGGTMTATYADSSSLEFDKEEFNARFAAAQSILIEISTGKRVHYKLATAAR